MKTSIVRLIKNKIVSMKKPIEYAISVGVDINPDGGSRLLSTNFGSEPWLISIGNHVEITNDVIFITHDGATWVIRDDLKYKDVIKYGRITIKDNCFVGVGTIILPGVTIGPNSIVAAGSVVTKNVLPNSVYAGNPAKYICSLDEYAAKSLANNPVYDLDAYKKTKKLRYSES